MPQVLREIGLPTTNTSSHNALNNHNDGATKRGSKKGSKKYVRNGGGGLVDPNKENASQVENFDDDVFPADSGCDFSAADCGPCSDIQSLSKDSFRAFNNEKVMAALAEVPGFPKPCHHSTGQKEKRHHIIMVLERIRRSDVPNSNALQDVLISENIETSIREAYDDALLQSIYGMMLQHKTVEAVQILGAQLLQKTVMCMSKSSLDVGRGNGIQLLVYSMLSNKGSVAIQTAASATLAALCTTTENRIIAGKFFVVETIMDATQTFKEDKYLQGACMKLLTAIASETENSGVIVRTRSMRLPLRVIRRHGGSLTLVRMACECAQQLLRSFDEAAIESLSESKVMKLFVCVILHFADDKRTQTAAIGSALLMCRKNDTCLRDCVRGRTADLCVRNLKRYRGRDHWKLHLVCMELLCLFAEVGGHKIVVTAGGVEGCLTCMIEMRRVFPIQSCCLSLLEHIVSTDEEPFLQRIIKAGGIEVLNTSLKAYISREDFVERGVRIMRALRG